MPTSHPEECANNPSHLRWHFRWRAYRTGGFERIQFEPMPKLYAVNVQVGPSIATGEREFGSFTSWTEMSPSKKGSNRYDSSLEVSFRVTEQRVGDVLLEPTVLEASNIWF
ncbi:hypothetical protein FRB91_005141 [Serendipita sp. 411]|nr:hypothetical protein FRB91_005141 [Serendipita sp. 411]